MRSAKSPVALTIAGSDSGGGAGVQIDLKVFCALGVYGASVITAVTAQNSVGVRGFRALPSSLVEQQLEAVLEDLPVGAAKTGMLWSAENVLTVAQQFSRRKMPPLVVDPVIFAKDGTRLLSRRAERALVVELLPLAAVITPNLPEAAALCGENISNLEEMRQAAEKLIKLGAKSILVKGGHLKGRIVDLFFDGKKLLELPSQRNPGKSIHGTGCALSAAVTAYLAKGLPLAEAVCKAHAYLQELIQHPSALGKGHRLLLPEKNL